MCFNLHISCTLCEMNCSRRLILFSTPSLLAQNRQQKRQMIACPRHNLGLRLCWLCFYCRVNSHPCWVSACGKSFGIPYVASIPCTMHWVVYSCASRVAVLFTKLGYDEIAFILHRPDAKCSQCSSKPMWKTDFAKEIHSVYAIRQGLLGLTAHWC